MSIERTLARRVATLAAAALVAGCGGGDAGAAGGGGAGLTGAVVVDGSSTVYPITEAVAEEFSIEHGSDVRVTVGVSGTGGGFKRFCSGETDISNASRPIKQEEIEQCEQAGIEYLELAVGYDGIAVATNPETDFVTCLTVEELARIWGPSSDVRRWSDVRPDLPATEIALYGPGTDSGTFDYFTESIMGEEDASRSDYTASEDDNVLVQGVAGDRGSLGYFGFAYYEENAQRLKLLGVDNGSGCVQPSAETIASGQYAPLSREIFIYVNEASLEKPAVRAFADYYMQTAGELVPQVGYISLEDARYQENLQTLEQATSGGSGTTGS